MSQPKLSGDSVRAYLRDIGRIPLLEHDEEILLGRKVQRLMELENIRQELQEELGHKIDDNELAAHACDHDYKGLRRELREGRKAKEKMVTANLRLVVSVAKNILKETWNSWTSSRKGQLVWYVVSKSLTLIVVISLVPMLIGGYVKGSRGPLQRNRGQFAYRFMLQRTSTNLRKHSEN